MLEQENRGVSVARNTGLAAASGKYLAFPDIDDKLYPGMYRTLLEMAEKEHLDIATCNGTYVYEKRRESHPIFPLDRLPSTDVLPGHVWLKQALDSRKFLHVTGLIFIVTTLSASITSISSRPAPSGYPMDHRSPAGRGARAVHQSAVL
nr:putative glycosyl transferase [Klebsiella pneumoniae]